MTRVAILPEGTNTVRARRMTPMINTTNTNVRRFTMLEFTHSLSSCCASRGFLRRGEAW